MSATRLYFRIPDHRQGRPNVDNSWTPPPSSLHVASHNECSTSTSPLNTLRTLHLLLPRVTRKQKAELLLSLSDSITALSNNPILADAPPAAPAWLVQVLNPITNSLNALQHAVYVSEVKAELR